MNKIVPFMLLFLICTPLVTVFTSVLASELLEDSWSTKASINHERRWFSITVLDDQIYAIGGYLNGLSVAFNERYDPVTDNWVTLASMPTSRLNFGVVTYQGKIYCIGGEVPYFGSVVLSQSIDVVEVYDPISDTWIKKASFPINP
ncbi:MAG: hypothetical protein FWF66_02650 [Candidatus Bathyarchaeota archaeon]|nr:hypothetical protein [Candidatus Termiticorpusculum sp.]